MSVTAIAADAARAPEQIQKMQVHGIGFDWNKLDLVLLPGQKIKINGTVAEIDPDDWEDLRMFGPNPDRFGNVSRAHNSTLFFWLADRILNESDNEVQLHEFYDHRLVGQSRYFLVWNKRKRSAAIELLEYIHDSFQTVLDAYQLPRVDAVTNLKHHVI